MKHPDRCPNARLVLYSDDICAIVRNEAELQEIFTHICRALEYFNMRLDYSKSQLLRIGDSVVDQVTLYDHRGVRSTTK